MNVNKVIWLLIGVAIGAASTAGVVVACNDDNVQKMITGKRYKQLEEVVVDIAENLSEDLEKDQEDM